MGHRSNYVWILFLILPMAFVRVRTHDFVLTVDQIQSSAVMTINIY